MSDQSLPQRTYRTSEVSPEHLADAIAEGRVLFVHGGSRAYGTGDVWFTIGASEDLDKGQSEGLILAQSITEESLAVWNDSSWDSTWEFWEVHDSGELDWPCRQMTPKQRVQFKQAVSLLTAYLIELLPLTLSAGDVPYVELLRLYARDPNPELAQRVVACAGATGWRDALFDPGQEWERMGRMTAVETFLRKELPQSLGESLIADRVAATGPIGHYDAWAARDWLKKAIGRWATDAAWDIQQGDGKSLLSLPDMPQSALFAEFRTPPRQELEPQLVALLGEMNETQSNLFQRECIGELTRRLRLLPEMPPGLPKLLDTAWDWAGAQQPEILARADLLAEDAIRIGGHTLFGRPFQMMSLSDPVAIVSQMCEGVRVIAAIRFQACTRDLEVRPEAEQEASEKAVDAMLEQLRRYVQMHILTG